LNSTRRSQGLFLILAVGWVRSAAADTIVDVSEQWKAHVSTSPTSNGGSAGLPHVSTATASTAVPNNCECESLSNPEKLEQCTYAFTGTVIEASPPKKGKRNVSFDVDEVFKGSPKQEMPVVEEVSEADCDLPFEIGQSYLVFARWEWGAVMTSRCMGTKLLEKANRAALGPSEALKEKMYLHLRDACMGRLDTVCCLSSLKAMRVNYHVPEPEEGCPSGSVPDRLSCAGSYTWCIPLTETSHGPQER